MIFSIHVILIIILAFDLVHTYKIDVFCPTGSRFESQCATFFNPTYLNLTNIQLNIIDDLMNIGSTIVIDLDGSTSSLQSSIIGFYPFFTLNYQCGKLEYYSSTIVKATQNCIPKYIVLLY